MTKWSCALTRFQEDCVSCIFLSLKKINDVVFYSLSFFHARIGNTGSISGVGCGISLEIIVKILFFKKILNSRKAARSFFLEHKRKIDAKAVFDVKGCAVMKWRRADEESRIWKLV